MIGKKISAYLQRKTTTADGVGGWTESWEDIKKLKATFHIHRTTNGEERKYNKITVVSDTYLLCDYYAITEKDRIRIGEKYYDIINVENINMLNKYLKIYIQLRD